VGRLIIAAVVVFWVVVEIWLLLRPPYFGLAAWEEFFIVLAFAALSIWSVERAVEESDL